MKMTKKFITIFLIVLVFVASCSNNGGGGYATGVDTVVKFSNETLPLSISNLPLMDITSVDSFQKYEKFATYMNNLIEILNEQSDIFNIPFLVTTREGWKKASRFIVEYGPLIDNYNEVVTSAKNQKENPSEENAKTFYIAAGKFGFETALIVGAVFYTVAFQGVGIVYRAVNLNTLAFKCGTCVKIILSNAHWTIRTALVEGSSQLAQTITDLVDDLYQKNK